LGCVTSRRFSLWQKLVALAPLLLLAVVLPGEIMVRCHLDGLLRPAPCCSHQPAPADCGPAFEARDCCDREVTATDRPVSEVVRATDGGQIAAAAFMPRVGAGALLVAPANHSGWAAQRYGPMRGGPPIVLVKRAFLI
jgi:hypothetical protein